MKYVLQNFETFENNEEAYLKVNKNSNLYCVILGKDTYIAWQKINVSLLANSNFTEIEKIYYDVTNGTELLRTTEYKSITSKENAKSKFILLLSELLNIKDNEEKYLSFEDVKKISNNINRKKLIKKTNIH